MSAVNQLNASGWGLWCKDV